MCFPAIQESSGLNTEAVLAIYKLYRTFIPRPKMWPFPVKVTMCSILHLCSFIEVIFEFVMCMKTDDPTHGDLEVACK